MSAGDPVFKAYAVYALHVGAVFADEYGTCRYGAYEQFRRSDFADVAVVYPDAVGQERIARTSAGAFKVSPNGLFRDFGVFYFDG